MIFFRFLVILILFWARFLNLLVLLLFFKEIIRMKFDCKHWCAVFSMTIAYHRAIVLSAIQITVSPIRRWWVLRHFTFGRSVVNLVFRNWVNLVCLSETPYCKLQVVRVVCRDAHHLCFKCKRSTFSEHQSQFLNSSSIWQFIASKLIMLDTHQNTFDSGMSLPKQRVEQKIQLRWLIFILAVSIGDREWFVSVFITF